MSRPIAAASLLVLLAMGLAGCSAYQLGVPAENPFATIYVAPVDNQAFMPMAESVLTSQILHNFERDGRLQPDSENSAEAILTVRLVDLQREIRVMTELDTGLARKIRLTLNATCTLASRDGQTIWFTDRPVFARTEVYINDGQNPAEYEATPVLTRTLAEKISRAVLDTW